MLVVCPGEEMYIPCGREKVRVAGRREVFFVLAVNLEERLADMIPLDGVAYVEQGVPFALIEPYEKRSVGKAWNDVTPIELPDDSAMK